MLVDEAYCDLMEDSRRTTMVDLVLKGAKVIMARTFQTQSRRIARGIRNVTPDIVSTCGVCKRILRRESAGIVARARLI